MKSDHLKLFYQNEPQREAVKEFMLELLDEKALRDIYKGNDVSGYKEAKTNVDKLFGRLEELYGEKDKVTQKNPAR